MKGFYSILILLLLSIGQIDSVQAAPPVPSGVGPLFPKPVEDYHDEQIAGIAAKLVQRIQAEPFNLVGTLILLGAIIHTFLASKFMLISHRLEHQYHALKEQEKDTSDDRELSRMRDRLQFRAQLFHFLGEVEAVFGDGRFPAGFVFRRGLPRQGGKSGEIHHRGLVAGDSDGGTDAGILYHRTRCHDDLCAPASAEVL
jgi:hypothetical protein